MTAVIGAVFSCLKTTVILFPTPLAQILPPLFSGDHNNVIFSAYNRFEIDARQPGLVFQQSVRQCVAVNL